MAITDAQRALRATKLGSSDAPKLMAGRWPELWRNKTGRSRPPNLDLNPAVQIGVATEALHGRFFQHRTGLPCFPAGERTYEHPTLAFMVAHLDFLTWRDYPTDPERKPDAVLEAKFHGGALSDEELATRHYWQVQHQMAVAGLDEAVLSILRPGAYSFVRVRRDEADIRRLLETAEAFWWHVENDFEPEDMEARPAPDFEAGKALDMTGHNGFAALAAALTEHRDGHRAFREAEAALKALTPERACIAFLPGRDGLYVARSRDGKLTIKFGDAPRKHQAKARSWLEESFDAEEDQS